MMKKLLTAVSISTALFTSGSLNAAVPNSFSAGTPAVAAEVNENFDNLDQRLSALEGVTTSTVNVDCSADSGALKNTTLSPNTTYVLTGICDGQIVVGTGLGTIKIEGDATGSKDDGITLQAGETGDDVFAAIYGVYGVNLQLANLTIDASAYISRLDKYIAVVGSYRGATVSFTDVDIIGGDEGLQALNTGTMIVRDNVTVSGFGRHGLRAARAGLISVVNTIEVIGSTSSDHNISEAVAADRGGIVDLSNDGDAATMHSIVAADGPNLSIANDNIAAVSAFQNGTIRINDADITGVLWSGESSAVDIRDSVQGEGYINPYRNSVMRIRNSQVANGNSGTLFSGDFSVLRMDNTTVGNASGTGSIDTYRYGVVDLRGSTDLNGRDINCAEPRELRIDGSVTNVGTTC